MATDTEQSPTKAVEDNQDVQERTATTTTTSTSTSNDEKEKAVDPSVTHAQIQNDVRQLLTEMKTSFETVSHSVLTKLNVMQHKVQELETNAACLTDAVDQTNENENINSNPFVQHRDEVQPNGSSSHTHNHQHHVDH